MLVVVRGYSYREDLAALRAYIRDIRPVLVGVDGGADALLDDGYVPDLILGDMDSVSDRALSLASKRSRRRPPTELVLHAYTDGRAPGGARLERLGVPYTTVRSAGTSEDVAFLLAHEKRAELIVAVGTHGNLREFLDKGRSGMSSTFLVRLRVGEILVDAKGVSRIYGNSRLRARDTFLLVGSALLTMLIVVTAISPSVRLFFDLAFEHVREWFVHLQGARVIPWRYHLVSIMAIFLALGLGVVVGTTVINPGLVKNLNDQTDGLKEDLRQLQQEQQDLQAQLDTMNTFSDQAMPYLVADELFGRQVVVVTQEGVDPRALAETRRALDLSGRGDPDDADRPPDHGGGHPGLERPTSRRCWGCRRPRRRTC